MGILDKFKKKEKRVKPQKAEKILKTKAKYNLAYQTIIRPIISEKATDLQVQGKYVFEVAFHATKNQISNAIKEVYGVKPISVRTVKLLGKQRRYGRTTGYTSRRKKAIVTIPAEKKLEVFEGV